MASAEKNTICKTCVNRKLDFSKGLVCGLTGEKPSSEKGCGDYQIDANAIVHQTERKKRLENQEIKGMLAFFLYFFLPGGIIFTIILNYHIFDKVYLNTLPFFFWCDLSFLAFYIFFCAYTIYAFIAKRSDAVFSGRVLLILLSINKVAALIMGFTAPSPYDLFFNPSSCVKGILVAVILFVFLCVSGDVENRIPKESRKTTLLSRVMTGLAFIVPIILFALGVMTFPKINQVEDSTIATTVSEDDFNRLYSEVHQLLPINLGEAVLADVPMSEGKVIFQICYPVLSSDLTRDMATESLIQNRESIYYQLSNWRSGNKLDSLVAFSGSTGRTVVMGYYDQEGKEIYAFTLPSGKIQEAMTSPYQASSKSMIQMAAIIKSNVPTPLFDNYVLEDLSYYESRDLLCYYIDIRGASSSELNSLTEDSIKAMLLSHMNEFFDTLLWMRTCSQKSIEFDVTADSPSFNKKVIILNPSDYNPIIMGWQ